MEDNTDKNRENEQFPIMGNGSDCDCNSDDCCPSGSSGSGKSHRTIKTMVFIVVMLAAVAVGAYSLFDHQTETGGADLVIGIPIFDALTLQQQDYTGKILDGDQFGFLTLKGAGAALDKNAEVESLTESAAALIRKKGVTVTTTSVAPGDSLFANAVDLFGVSNLPAVLAMNKEGGFVLIAGNITENNLLKTFLSGCSAADCGTGCDPKDCGN